MDYSSFDGRLGQYHPRDGPRPDLLPHSTNGSGPRIPRDERGSRSNSHYHKTQNQDQKKTYGRQNYHGNHNSNYRSGPYQGDRTFHQENYRLGNNYGRAPPSGPRYQQCQTQGYNSSHRPGVTNGPRAYFSKQESRQNDYQVSNYQNHQFVNSSHDSSRRYCGGRSRDNNQNQSLQQQQPVPVTSRYRSIDEPDLFDEPIEPVAPILGSDGMYYDAEGDTIIEDAPEVDLVAIVTQGTVEMAKITQSLLEQIAAFG
ncbi:hypothetical protein N7476_005826 [Penicillium atrosanguineum]|uniref:Cyclic nucleotide-binding domain-containing protein n=1 Tax=Penicillium atrosanguineum TaxID=1132637 RepID=A0A9W9PXY2_9EURO|nr:hypothetical protein N7476_005826 [Penicillium atrosanguineum]